MARTLTESEVSEILKVPVEAVRRLFEQGALTGEKTGEGWLIVPEVLEADISILTETARVKMMQSGGYVSPWAEMRAAEGPPALPLDRLNEIIEALDSQSG